MAVKLIAKLFTIVGFSLLVHATYAVVQYRDLLKMMQEDFVSLPHNLIAEVLIGSGLCLIGAYELSGKLKPAVFERSAPSMDMHVLRNDFMFFNTRTKAFSDLAMADLKKSS